LFKKKKRKKNNNNNCITCFVGFAPFKIKKNKKIIFFIFFIYLFNFPHSFFVLSLGCCRVFFSSRVFLVPLDLRFVHIWWDLGSFGRETRLLLVLLLMVVVVVVPEPDDDDDGGDGDGGRSFSTLQQSLTCCWDE
jgi:hypothetical protein